MGGGTDEVFYNFTGTKVTKLKVKIEKPGNYGLAYINGNISEERPTIIDWGNGTTKKLTYPINYKNKSTDFYTNYSEPGKYVISIDGWYNHFQCYNYYAEKSGGTQINKVLIEIIQVSSLITDFRSTFQYCSNLTSTQSGLFDKNTEVTSFERAFEGCKNLTGETPYTLSSDGKKIKLWNRDGTNGFAKPTSTFGAFTGCAKLTDFKDIPSDWK